MINIPDDQMRNPLSRTFAILAAIAGALLLHMPPIAAQPAAPRRLVYPVVPGGPGDAIARIVAERLQAALGEPFVVENRAGASGRIGVQVVINAAGDGKTLLIVPIAPICVLPHVYPALGYDPFKDLAPVSQLATFDFSLAVGAQVRVSSLRGLIEWVRQDAARAVYASPVPGALPHFFGAMFSAAADLKLRHVSYRGAAAATTDVVAGAVPILVNNSGEVIELRKNGKVRILATSGKARSSTTAEISTFTEAGYAISGDSWFALYAPAATPKPTVDRVNAIVVAGLQEPGIKQRITSFGGVPTGTSPERLAQIQAADFAKWGPVIKASGFKPEN